MTDNTGNAGCKGEGMSAHTPEPWPAFGGHRKLSYWQDPSTHQGGHCVPLGPSDYSRARACVNACAGIPTPALETMGFGVGSLEAFKSLQKQRDELQAKYDELLAAIAAWEASPTTANEFAIKEAAAKHRGQQS